MGKYLWGWGGDGENFTGMGWGWGKFFYRVILYSVKLGIEAEPRIDACRPGSDSLD